MNILSSFKIITSVKMAGNFPALDGPGSYDQPKEINDFVTLSICQNY